jgi:hypothetical protein
MPHKLEKGLLLWNERMHKEVIEDIREAEDRK